MLVLNFLRLSALVAVVVAFSSCSRSADSYREAGDRYLAEGKFADAVLNYRNALLKQPNSAEAVYGLAMAELNQSNVKTARDAFSRAVTLKPDYREAMVRLADLDLMLFEEDPRRPAVLYEQASQLVKRLMEMDANSFDALRLQGQIALLDQRADQAIELLTKASAKQPLDKRVTFPLVRSLLAANRSEEASKLADSAFANDPKFIALYDLLYRFYVSSNRQAEAESILKRKVAANPQEVDFPIQLAGFYAAGNQMSEADAVLKTLSGRAKEFPDANFRIAKMYLTVGKAEEAKRYLEEGLRVDAPRKGSYLKQLGALAWAQNDRKKAIEYARGSVEANPDDDEARRFKASFLLEAGTPEDLPSVIEDYSRLVAKSPKDKILNNQLGLAYRAKGDKEAAWKYFQMAIQNSQTYLAPRLSLAELASEQRNNEQTLRYLDEILTVDKANPRMRLYRASTLRVMGRLPEARRDVQALLAANPGNADIRIESGLLSLAENRPKEAEANFSQLYQAGSSDVRQVIGLAESYAVQKQFSKAIQLLEAEVQKAPKDIGPRVALARMIGRSGNANGALDQYRQLIATDPKVALYHLESGQLLLSQGNAAQALESLQKAASLAPKEGFVQYTLATALHSARKLDEARTHYQQALTLDPNNPNLLNNFAFLHVEQGTDLDRGVELAQKAIAKDANNPSYSDTLGLLYLKKNNTDGALQVLRPVVAKNPESATFRLHLAQALSQKGLRDEAKQELQTALTKQPSSEDAAAIRELLAKIGG